MLRAHVQNQPIAHNPFKLQDISDRYRRTAETLRGLLKAAIDGYLADGYAHYGF